GAAHPAQAKTRSPVTNSSIHGRLAPGRSTCRTVPPHTSAISVETLSLGSPGDLRHGRDSTTAARHLILADSDAFHTVRANVPPQCRLSPRSVSGQIHVSSLLI